jgi:hypothetical protein
VACVNQEAPKNMLNEMAILSHALSQKLADVSELLTASIIRAVM